MTSSIDLVYVLRPGDNEELRYSLRSIHVNAQGMFRRVWFVGDDLPDWLTTRGRIGGPFPTEKFAAIRAKAHAATKHKQVAKRIAIMNDDNFAINPVTDWTPYHLGPTSRYLVTLAGLGVTSRRNTWARAIEQTAAWMAEQGHGDVLCRENHTPAVYDKHRLRAAFEQYPADRPNLFPEMFDLAGVGGPGIVGPNVKVKTDSEFSHKLAAAVEAGVPWLSSNDESFASGEIGRYIREMFPDPSPWEVP